MNMEQPKVTTFKCPICMGFMTVFREDGNTNSGLYLRCDNVGCLPHENVFGYGSTEKAAHEIACQKYKKS